MWRKPRNPEIPPRLHPDGIVETPRLLDEDSFESFVSSRQALPQWPATQPPGIRKRHLPWLVRSRGLYEMFGLKGSATGIFRERVVLYFEPGIPAASS